MAKSAAVMVKLGQGPGHEQLGDSGLGLSAAEGCPKLSRASAAMLS